MKKNKEEKKVFFGTLLTICIVACSLLIFFFTESGYGKEEKPVLQAEATPSLPDERKQRTDFESEAFAGINYEIGENGVYTILRPPLSNAYLSLSFQDGILTAFLLRLEMPQYNAEEKEESSILADRFI